MYIRSLTSNSTKLSHMLHHLHVSLVTMRGDMGPGLQNILFESASCFVIWRFDITTSSAEALTYQMELFNCKLGHIYTVR